ncbi:MAG: hypothetical protein WBF33_19020 [Candidatus Nitrosopolaris sp.]|jgi:hypothetical protein
MLQSIKTNYTTPVSEETTFPMFALVEAWLRRNTPLSETKQVCHGMQRWNPGPDRRSWCKHAVCVPGYIAPPMPAVL